MKILDTPVSIFRNYHTATNPKSVTIRQFLTSTKYKNEVEAIRASTDKAEQNRLKSLLPACTMSGLFSERNKQNLIQHSGLICLDIDLKDNTAIKNYDSLKSELVKINNVAFCIRSVSGKGYAVGIFIAHPDKHELHFEALKQIFETKFNIIIDKACKDVSRLRGYSYDTDVYLNDDAVAYTQTIEPKKATYRPNIKPYQGSNDNDKVESMVKQIERQRVDITGGYAEWFAIGCCVANEFNENGRDLFQRISQFAPTYKTTDTDAQFSKCLKKRTAMGLGTFFYYCDLAGVRIEQYSAPSFKIGATTVVTKAPTQTCNEAYPTDWDVPTSTVPRLKVHTPQSLGLIAPTHRPLNEAEIIELMTGKNAALQKLIDTLDLTLQFN